jgi:hypothetical protein
VQEEATASEIGKSQQKGENAAKDISTFSF